MLSIWAVLVKLCSLLFMFVLTLLIWVTIEYFSKLPEADKNKPIIAWDILMLILFLISTAIDTVFR